MAVRHYRVSITTTGPVHVGNGQKYGKKDYFVLDDRSVGVLDAPRFVEGMSPADIDAYCAFLETDSRSGLQDFLSGRPALMEHARACLLYRADMRLVKNRGGRYQYLDVFQCVKDAYCCPYVPGSSVKGMLRTALLTHIVRDDPATYRRLYDPRRAIDREERKRAARDLERAAFWLEHLDPERPEEATDIMRHISVSDSDPLDTSQLVFAKKFDRFSKADPVDHKLNMGKMSREARFAEGNELNIYRESLRPDTTITLTLDIDDRIDAYLGGLTLDLGGVTSVLEEAFDLYRRCFLDAFDLGEASPDGGGGASDGRCRYVYQAGPLAGRRCRNAAVGGTGYCNTHKAAAKDVGKRVSCCLGGGVDFDSKTVMAALLEDLDPHERAYEISRVLYAQFPTQLDHTDARNDETWANVEEAGFVPAHRKFYGRQRKFDHRHWRDAELGVSPHTAKLAVVGGKRYPMGRCTIEIEEA